MKTYYADANVFLRFLLRDNQEHYQQSESYFQKAKADQIKIIILPEIIQEIEYVLRKVYKKTHLLIADYLLTVAQTPYFIIENRNVLLAAIDIYKNSVIDLVDIILFCSARENKAEVLSFDKDFKKLINKISKTQLKS